ncbi:hypothetical protein ACXYRP_01765 [Mycoplasma sp. 5912]
MRVVRDYQKFADYKNKADEKLLPIVTTVVNNILTPEVMNEYKKAFKKFWVSLLSTIIPGVVFLIIGAIIISVVSNGFIPFFVFLILFIISILIGVILGAVYWRKFYRFRVNLAHVLKQNLNQEALYVESFNILDDEMDYIPTEESTDFKEAFRHCQVSKKDLHRFTVGIPGGAYISEVKEPKHCLLMKHYPLSLINVHWVYERRDSKGNLTEEKHYYTGMLKIDTRYLEDKAMVFTLMVGKLASGSDLQKIQMENKEFNKYVTPMINDRFKATMMFTPLSQELMLKRLKDTQGSKIKRFNVFSTGDFIYLNYNVDFGFMYLNVPLRLKNKEIVINKIYNDLLIDTYTLYYMLSFINIPIYLQ